jgi:NADH-quinone oxidoreductase subunit J
MEAITFWIVAAGMVISAIAVIANRNPVACALSLALTFIFLAVGFLSLQAFFLAMVQVIVYAGAVMVLFLFIIMLLDLREGARRPLRWGRLVVLAVISILPMAIFQVIASDFALLVDAEKVLNWKEGSEGAGALSVWTLGKTLFQDYLMAFLATAILLLIATLGVVILSRRPMEGELEEAESTAEHLP